MDREQGVSGGGTSTPIGWAISDAPVDYEIALAAMERHVEAMIAGEAGELVWLLEHPSVYTAGTSAREADVRDAGRFRVIRTGRGGQLTYHGPGQRVAYLMLDVRRHAPARQGGDLRAFVTALEGWLVDALAEFNLSGETRPDRVGVWVARPDKGPRQEDKIAAIGIRVRRWISFHGLSLNVEPDLTHFDGIVPCGISASPETPFGVTSLVDLGLPVTLADADIALRATFEHRFGPTRPAPAPA